MMGLLRALMAVGRLGAGGIGVEVVRKMFF
jgi:hypothetical protein